MFPWISRLGRAALFWSLLLCAGGFLLSASGQPAPGEGPVIRAIEVRHVGPRAVSDQLVLSNIRVKPGDRYSRLNIDDDVRNLYATGYFFNIRVAEERGVEGLTLVYFVQGRPVLADIRFEGNERFSVRRLQRKVTARVGEPLDEAQLFKDARAIQELYERRGFFRTQVKYNLNVDENAGRGTVVFEIQEVPKVRIRDVEFVDAQAFSPRKLRKAIKTRRWWIFSWLTGSGRLKEDQFEEDKERLAEFYRNEGYIDFALKDWQIEPVDERRIILRLFVAEGRQYRVGSVTFEGNRLFTTNEIIGSMRRREGTRVLEGLNLSPGEVFRPNLHARDIELIEDFYGSRGYIDVTFPATLKALRVPNVEQQTIDLLYRVTEGDRSYIEKIEIRGNDRTRDRVIRRELAVAPGEIFNMVRVKVSTNRLYGLQYFEKVDARPEETDVPNRRNLVVNVAEKNTGNFTIGAGFSSVDALVGFAELSQGNFDLFNPPFFVGGGQKLRLRVQLGTERQDYVISFVEPWFLGRRLILDVDLYHRDLNYLSDIYDERRTGARVGLTRALTEFLRAGVSYTIENVNLDIDDSAKLFPVSREDGPGRTTVITTGNRAVSDEILAEEGERLVSKVGASLIWDSRNSVVLPDKGMRTEFIGEVAGGPFGADSDFYRLELRTSHYFKGFADGHVLEVIGRLGVVDAYDNTDRVPLFDRYFLGGLYSLRGFEFRDVGPVDETGEPVGGGTYWFGSAEYSVPIIERLRFAVFYDVGNVYNDAYSFDLRAPQRHTYNDNWGVGIRLNLPIGPIRLDYAFPITAEEYNDTSGGRFQFGVGYTREF
jgi:outer membrane protein insertion porin family